MEAKFLSLQGGNIGLLAQWEMQHSDPVGKELAAKTKDGRRTHSMLGPYRCRQINSRQAIST
jgi:hypothetical protein